MNKKKMIAAGIGVICLAGVIGAGVWYSNNNETAKKRAEMEIELQNATEQTTIEVEVPTENPSAGVYEIKTTPSDESVDEALYAKIAQLNTAAKTYFENNRSKLLSVYGLMYSDEDSFTVSASTVAKAAGVDVGEDIDDYADILMVRPSDLAKFDSLKISKERETSLKPFTAYNSSEGYIISSADDKGGVLTKDEYKKLLGTYATDHGSISNPDSKSELYLDIAASAATAFDENEYDIKYLACDDMYAVVVIGGITEPNNIKEFVLVKKPGGWSVTLDGVESFTMPRQSVNDKIPDMELGLLPKYTIAAYGDIKSGFVEFEQSLIKLGMISEDDMPETYSCGAGRFAYIELSSGKKLLGIVNSEKKLEFIQVGSTNEAIAAMLKVDEKPPAFILKYSE